LKLKYDEPLGSFAFVFNLRRYIVGTYKDLRSSQEERNPAAAEEEAAGEAAAEAGRSSAASAGVTQE